MKKTLLHILLFIATQNVSAQTFSNKGKDFWVGYGYHQGMVSGNQQDMVLYFVTDQVTNVTVTIPGVGYSQTYSNIPANTVFTSEPIPKSGNFDARLVEELNAAQNKGIHIVADKAIVAYAHIYQNNASGATLLFPTNTLGKEYYSINYENITNSPNANGWFYVIACDTGTTTVEIIPSANTLTHTAGVPFTVTLSQGQIYNFLGELTQPLRGVDLTGTRVRSITSASGTCKKISVFSGSGRISIFCDGTSGSSDNYMVQAFPKFAWGNKFLTSPTAVLTNNPYRICVSDPSAHVTINGAPLNPVDLVNNFYYQLIATNRPMKIESDLPVTVVQYISSAGGCGNPTGNGDPEVIYLSPVEQRISKVIWNATPNFEITDHFFTVVIPNSGTAISSFKLDGAAVNPGLFNTHPADPDYSFLTQPVNAGQRIIESDSGFNAIAYGFGVVESYGYNAGTNLRDLYTRVGVKTTFGLEDPASRTCIGTPFKFKISLPYLVDSIHWNLSGLPGGIPGQTVAYSTPPTPLDADSIGTLNGILVYWYSLPGNYTVGSTGTFPIEVTAYPAIAEGCGNQNEFSFDLEIKDPPIPDFEWRLNGCIGEPVQFSDQSAGIQAYQWYWDFDDPSSGASNYSSLPNPVHIFSNSGTYEVRYAIVTTTGCISDTIEREVIIPPLPVGTISGDTTICQNASSPSIVFTGITGTAPFTFTYNINNGPSQTIVTAAGNNSVGLPVPTDVMGTNFYYLESIRDATGTAGCFNISRDTVSINVEHVNPEADFTADKSAICIGDNVLFTSTGNGGDGFITNWYWNFDDGNNSTVDDPSHTFATAKEHYIKHWVMSNFGCVSDTVTQSLKVYLFPTVNAGNDLYILEGTNAVIEATYTGEDNMYLWSPATYLNNPSLANPVTTPLTDITYTITVNNPGGCSGTDELRVVILKAPNIPNTFTPNGDGINERWLIQNLEAYPRCRVMVFTRTGSKVFESSGYTNAWDGNMNGKPLPMDTYYYIIETNVGGKNYTGFVTIIK